MTSPSNWKTDRIQKIAERTGYSEAEVEEALVHQIDLICAESDLAWNGKPLSEVVEQARQDRKNVLVAIHFLSQSTRELVTMAQERTNVMASAAIMVTRRLGVAKALPELATDQELQEDSGYIDSAGRLIREPAQPGEVEFEPAKGGKAIEISDSKSVFPQQSLQPSTSSSHTVDPKDENLDLTEILPESPSPLSPQGPRR